MAYSEYHEEWQGWQTLGDPVLHIQLRDWADIAIVAPLAAHSLAKFATGLCDDPLSCVVRAWDLGYHESRPGKPLILAPAMNTAMWEVRVCGCNDDNDHGFWEVDPSGMLPLLVYIIKQDNILKNLEKGQFNLLFHLVCNIFWTASFDKNTIGYCQRILE